METPRANSGPPLRRCRKHSKPARIAVKSVQRSSVASAWRATTISGSIRSSMRHAAYVFVDWTDPVWREIRHRKRAAQFGHPECLVVRPALPRPMLLLPAHILFELHRFDQGRGLTPACGPIQRSQVAVQDPGGPAVADDVVHRDQEEMFLAAETNQLGPEEWKSGKVEWASLPPGRAVPPAIPPGRLGPGRRCQSVGARSAARAIR